MERTEVKNMSKNLLSEDENMSRSKVSPKPRLCTNALLPTEVGLYSITVHSIHMAAVHRFKVGSEAVEVWQYALASRTDAVKQEGKWWSESDRLCLPLESAFLSFACSCNRSSHGGRR